MTLSRFLRDYVFLPLADMRIAGTRHTVAQYVLAILATMALCGLWHGAGWNFVLWGVMHGVAIIVALGWRRYAIRPPRVVGWFLTVLFFLLSGIVFRTGTLDAAWNLYSGLAVTPSLRVVGKVVASRGGHRVRDAAAGVAGALRPHLRSAKDDRPCCIRSGLHGDDDAARRR